MDHIFEIALNPWDQYIILLDSKNLSNKVKFMNIYTLIMKTQKLSNLKSSISVVYSIIETSNLSIISCEWYRMQLVFHYDDHLYP